MSTTASDVAWRRLHPASLAVNLVPRAWAVLRSSWPILVAIALGRRTDTTGLVDVSLLLVFFGMTIASTAVHFFTLRYRVVDAQLQLRTGLLNRQVRTLDAARIQNVERTRNVFQRVAGLVEVRIETASGREVEGLLSALTERDADELIDALQAGRARARAELPGENDATEEVLAAQGPAELLRYGTTATRWGLAAVAAGGVMELVQWTDPTRLEGLMTGVVPVAAGVAALSGTWVLGVGSAFVRHWGFRLVRHGDGLTAEEGLLTRRAIHLRPAKVQRVALLEPVLRRALGFVSVRFETAATGSGEGGTQRAMATVPVVETDAVAPLVDEVLHAGLGDALGALRPAHPRALRRALIGAALRGLAVGGALWWWQGPWGALGFAALPVFLVAAWLDYRWQGFAVTDRLVVARHGWFARQTVLAPRAKVQAVSVQQGPLLWRWGLGRVVVQVAGGVVVLPDLAYDECLALCDALSRLPRAA